MEPPLIIFLKQFTASLLPITIPLTLVFAIIFLFLGRNNLKKELKGIKRTSMVILLIIFLIGSILRTTIGSYFVTFYDEMAYISIAKNIILFGKAGICEYTDFEKPMCILYEKSVGFPSILSLVIPFVGNSTSVLSYVNLFFGSFLIVVIFLLSYLVFKNDYIAIYSAFLVSLTPLLIYHSRSIETSISSTFFISLALLIFYLYFKSRDEKLFLSAMSFLTIATAIRSENISLFPLFLLGFIAFNFKQKNKKIFFPLLYSLISISPIVLYLILVTYPPIFYHEGVITSPTGTYFNIEYIYNNVPLLESIALGKYYPLILNLLFILGVVVGFIKYKKETIFLLIPIICFVSLYATYFNALTRYFFTIFVCSFILMSVGINFIQNFINHLIFSLKKGIKSNSEKLSLLIMMTILITLFYPYLIDIGKPTDTNLGNQFLEKFISNDESSVFGTNEIIYVNNETAFLTNFTKDADKCYGIINDPKFLGTTDLKPISTKVAIENDISIKNIIQNGNCVLFLEDMFCANASLNVYCGYDANIKKCEELNITHTLNCGFGPLMLKKCEEAKMKSASDCKTIHEKYDLKEYRIYKFNVTEISINSAIERTVEFKIYNVTLKNN